jgi:hypothetical protein
LFTPLRDPYNPAAAGLRGDSLARKVARRFFRCADADKDGSLDEQEGSTLRRVMQRFVEGKWNTSHSFATSEQRAEVALKLEELFRSVDLDGNSSVELDEWEMCASAIYEVLGRSAFLSLLSEPVPKRRRRASLPGPLPTCSRGEGTALFVMMMDGRVGLPDVRRAYPYP